MSKYHDDSTYASNPGYVRLAMERLAMWRVNESQWTRLWRRLVGDKKAEMLDEHLRLGDSRAAVVISVSPLLVAAYTDELDCIAMLRFPDSLASELRLRVGQRLLTVNTYARSLQIAPDLVAGVNNMGRWQNFFPLIAEFFSHDAMQIEGRKATISESEWERCTALAFEHLNTRPRLVRDGSPFKSWHPSAAV